MADQRKREEIITRFIRITCEECHWNNNGAVHALIQSTDIADDHISVDGVEFDYIPLITGSLAEFYVQPMLSCVGDIDIMCHHSNDLAIPGGYTPPTQLPGEFDRRVSVFEMTDSEYPGYVLLVHSYLLTECTEDGKYHAKRCKRRLYLVKMLHVDGPAETRAWQNMSMPFINHFHESVGHTDFVRCMRCLSWPSQASGWPTRHRSYGWPDSETVDRVVNDGCDVVCVCVTHPLYRQYKFLFDSTIQWRLSFSRAEITLINNWMPIQQIAYHVLRLFVKTERLFRLTDSADNSETGTLKKLSH